MVVMPVSRLRRSVLLARLRRCGAGAPDTARTLAEAGLSDPEAFRPAAEELVRAGRLGRTEDGGYYLVRRPTAGAGQ